MTTIEFATLILGLKDKFKFSITSWGRTPLRNKQVGSIHSDSQHIEWMAVDAVLDNKTESSEFKKAINEVNLGWLDEGDHIHIQRHLKDIPKVS